jgi:hypothetical protein
MTRSWLAFLFFLALRSASAGPQGETPDAPGVNDEAPDFELKDSEGKVYRLSELRGRNVILEFIRSGSW